MRRFVVIFIIFYSTCVYGMSVPETIQEAKKVPTQVIFLDETEVLGQNLMPPSKFITNNLSRTIKAYNVQKDVNSVLMHYEPRKLMQRQAKVFYDVRNKTHLW